jgi:XRE family transcriptional regulator, fatty acid utilization regulator
MTPRARIFAGTQLRALRQTRQLAQSVLAQRLGISVSYMSQLEHDDRPLSVSVLAALYREFPLDWADVQADATTRRFAALREALADPLFADRNIEPEAMSKLAEQQPSFADQFIALHGAYRRTGESLQFVDDAISIDAVSAGRLPWEEVRDWFHDAGNYVDSLDQRAEALWPEGGAGIESIRALLTSRYGLTVIAVSDAGPLRSFDRDARTLTLSSSLPFESRQFFMAHQLAALEMATEIADIAAAAKFRSDEARSLLRIGLTNYAAGAILMPYEKFRARARAVRHDIEQLAQEFGTSFEQTCHRLSTLQRPGARGVPFFFCRVDMAGNITKRHSATRLQFARFGGACPLWIVHEAVAIPDRILVQLAQMPDGVRYVSMAKGLVKPSGSFARAPRRFAVALGCEAEHAHEFIYSDSIDISGTATPIGISCRLCPRKSCDQRAFPPSDRAIVIDPDQRDIIPYKIG